LFGGLVNVFECREGVVLGFGIRDDLGDRGCERGLPMVDVTDGADVQVRLRTLELRLCHDGSLAPDLSLERLRGYSPRTRLMISSAIDSGTFWYESNCIV